MFLQMAIIVGPHLAASVTFNDTLSILVFHFPHLSKRSSISFPIAGVNRAVPVVDKETSIPQTFLGVQFIPLYLVAVKLLK